MWRLASPDDDDAIVAMCLALTVEDPWPEPVTAAQVRRTLSTLRAEPARGRAVVAEVNGRARDWYRRLGFSGSNTVLHRRRPAP